MKVSTQLRLTLCDPMDYSPSGISVHGILQARIPEWVAISLSRGSSQPRDQTQVSHIAGRLFTDQATGEGPSCKKGSENYKACKFSDTTITFADDKMSWFILLTFCSVQFSRSVVSDSLRPHESQHAKPPCPSPTPRVHSDSRPSSQ